MDIATSDDLSVFERGWLSSNNILLHGDEGEPATLIDSSHCLHAAQTVALVQAALRPGQTLAQVVNTHLHADHCGGNAAVQRAFPETRIVIPPGLWDAVQRWDEVALSYQPTGERCERFTADARLAPDDMLAVGRRRWQALAAPGHDPHSLILFDADDGVLISADALWANGFGVVFPELEGEAAFDVVGATLDLIESLDASLVIPGHGAPFTDVAGALQRARSRLASFRAEPSRHARHAIKVLLKFHLLEVLREPLPELLAWFEAMPLAMRVWQDQGRPEGTLRGWAERLLAELVASGAASVRGSVVHNA